MVKKKSNHFVLSEHKIYDKFHVSFPSVCLSVPGETFKEFVKRFKTKGIILTFFFLYRKMCEDLFVLLRCHNFTLNHLVLLGIVWFLPFMLWVFLFPLALKPTIYVLSIIWSIFGETVEGIFTVPVCSAEDCFKVMGLQAKVIKTITDLYLHCILLQLLLTER